MPKAKDTERSSKHIRKFVDREDLIDIFKTAMAEFAPERPKVLAFYGIGGIGKTELRKEFEQIAEDMECDPAWGTIDFAVPANRNLDNALFILRKTLDYYCGVKFPTFDLAYTAHWMKTHPQIPLNKDNFPLMEEGSLIADIVSTAGELPVIGFIPKVASVLKKGERKFSEWWKKRGEEALRDLPLMEPNEIAQKLPSFWATDLRDHLKLHSSKVVIFIDTLDGLWGEEKVHEKRFKHDEWVRDLISQLPEVLWVVCGRLKLAWEEVDRSWGDVLDQHLVGDLADEDAEDFLKSCEIEPVDVREVIIKASKGVPYFLDLAVDTFVEIKSKEDRPPVKSDFADDQTKVVERFLSYIDRAERETLKVLSVARFWDADIFKLLVKEFQTGFPPTAMKDLHRFSFIRPDEVKKQFTMHDLMREELHEKLDPDVRKRAHEFLFNYYNKELEKIDIRDITNIQKAALAEAFHHRVAHKESILCAKWFTTIANKFHDAAQWNTIEPLYQIIIAYLEQTSNLNTYEFWLVVYDYARLCSAIGNFDEAEKQLIRLLEFPENDVEQMQSLISRAANELAIIYKTKGKFAEAIQLYKCTLKRIIAELGQDHPHVASIISNISGIYEILGRFIGAEKLNHKALNILINAGEGDSLAATIILNNIAAFYIAIGKYDDAKHFCKKALYAKEKTLGENHPSIGLTLNNLALIYMAQGEYDEAEKNLNMALEITEKSLGPKHPELANRLHNIGGLCCKQGKFGVAEQHIIRASEILENAFGLVQPDLITCLESLSYLYEKMERKEEALKCRERAAEIRAKLESGDF